MYVFTEISVELITNLSQPRDDIYGPYNNAFLPSSQPIQHTQSPVVTGTSVVAIKYKDGVVIAADNLGIGIQNSISSCN